MNARRFNGFCGWVRLSLMFHNLREKICPLHHIIMAPIVNAANVILEYGPYLSLLVCMDLTANVLNVNFGDNSFCLINLPIMITSAIKHRTCR